MNSQGMALLRTPVSMGLLGAWLVLGSPFSWGAELNRDQLLAAIKIGRRELVDRQLENGAFPADGFLTHSLGTTCLATLALIKTSTSSNDPAVRSALRYLRSQPWREANRTHEIALGIMALVCNNHPDDLPLIEQLARRLVEAQTTQGGWPHQIGLPDGDLSISYFALLALRDASRVGVTIPKSVFEKARAHWLSLQNADGGWFDFAFQRDDRAEGVYTDASTFTATLAAITTLSTCQQMLEEQDSGQEAAICRHSVSPDEASQRALNWFQSIKTSESRSPHSEQAAVAFHLYGLELSGRRCGLLHPREREWYLEGARSLLAARNQRTGVWEGTNDVIATSHALLYLSTEVAPALIHRLQRDNPGDRHPHDVWNLTEQIVCRRGWQRCLTARDVTLSPEVAATERTAGVLTGNFRDVPVLFLTGEETPRFTDQELAMLRKYLDRGGVLLAAPDGNPEAFEQGFKTLLDQLDSTGSALLTALPADHPVYHAHFSLTPKEVVLYGVETGCRTAVFYCRENLSCGWESASPHQLSRQQPVRPEVELATKIGANVIACAMGDMVPTWPEASDFLVKHSADQAAGNEDRSLLQVAQLQHGRSWNAAPRAFTRLMQGVNTVHGPTVALTPRVLTLDSPELFDQMLLFLHGSHSFTLNARELDALRLHLQRGGFLFADACCGSAEFDASFRRMISVLFPGETLKVLPPDHEFFTLNTPHQLDKVKIRMRAPSLSGAPAELVIRECPPLLEGLEINGRLAVIYSRYDLSCALAEPGRSQCEGYFSEDALKIGVAVVLYTLVQDYHPAGVLP